MQKADGYLRGVLLVKPKNASYFRQKALDLGNELGGSRILTLARGGGILLGVKPHRAGIKPPINFLKISRGIVKNFGPTSTKAFLAEGWRVESKRAHRDKYQNDGWNDFKPRFSA